MVNAFTKSLIGITAALVAAGMASAQDDSLFHKAVRELRTNQPAVALATLNEYLQTNPGHEEAFELWKKTESAVWELLAAQKGEFATIGRHLMDLASSGRRAASRDEAKIAALVEQATKGEDYAKRAKAAITLAADHSEFAVPALVAVLGNADDGAAQDQAMLTLQKIGSPAVPPLLAALGSEEDLVRRNVAAALLHIGDTRAAAALARLATEDSNDSVREVARNGAAKLGVAPGITAVDLYTRDARAYLTGSGLRGHDVSEVTWSFENGQLVAHDVPAAIYHLELAKNAATEAMRLDPANDAAKTLLARAYLAEAATIKESVAANPEDEKMAALAAKIEPLTMVAMTTGPATLRRAMTDSLADRQNPVAIAAADALGRAESRDSLEGSPLVAALDNEDSRVAYAAALAMTKISQGSSAMPASAKVVDVLGRAVSEQAIRLVKVIGGGPTIQKAVSEANSQKGQGIAVDSSGTAGAGIADVYNFPNYDIIVVDENVPDAHPRHVIHMVRARAPKAKILLRANNEEAASAAYGELVDGIIAGDLSGEALVTKANELVENLDPRRAQANDIAVAAGHALQSIAGSKIDIAPALSSLEAQLNRSDDVAIPAARAIGIGGSQRNLKSLLDVVGGSGSVELRSAAAAAIGDILGRGDAVPTECFDALLAIAGDASADLGLRSAVVTALGRGNLAPGERLKLAASLAETAKTTDGATP